jgi:hypothetical protein
MALETATYIPQLVPSNPPTTDPIAQADGQIRLLKQVLQNQFPNVGTVAVTATGAALNNAAAAFSTGTVAAIPANGTVASAELDLLGLMNAGGTIVAGRVEFINSATSAQAGSLSIKMTDSADANPLTAITLTRDGTLAATTALNAPSVLQAGHALVPSGMIMLWSGSVASIPAGWVICDGTLGTPDLRDRFIVGAGNTYAVSATGGAIGLSTTTDSQGAHNHGGADSAAGSHNHGGTSGSYALQIADLAAHSHDITVTDPGHVHSPGVGAGAFVTVGTGGTLASGGSFGITTTPATASAMTGISATGASVGSGAAHSHSISSEGNHTHAITTDGNHTHSVVVASTLPPYYALCYVMKT